MSDWSVLAHGEWRELAPNLWIVDGSLSSMPLPRNMVVWRLPDGDLVLHSVICLDEAGMAKLESLGRPRWMIVPNEGHRLDAPAYKRRYPELTVLAPANARAKVEQKVAVDATCEDVLPGLEVGVHWPHGMKDGYELVYEVPLDGGGSALVANDVLGNAERQPGFGGWFMGLLGVPGGGLGQPRIVRLFFGKNRDAFRGFVHGLAERPDLRVLTVSHGAPVVGDVSSALRAAVI